MTRGRRLIAALALAAASVVSAAACAPQNSPAYFGTCPAGNQYPVQTQPGVWKCVNP